MNTLFRRVVLIGTALAVLNLTGCASPADREAMIPQSVAVAKKHPYSVAVEAKGGAETGAMDSSNISNADLKAALEGAIVKSGVFKNVVQGKNGDYDLTVSVIEMPKPIFGLTFTVDLEMAWSLVKRSDQSVAMRKTIKSTHTATFSDAAVAVTRLRLAVEGAARNNIAQGLKAISELDL
ncbi:MAG: hypothetical protein IV085_13825 [Thiobacillus sp.]|nr:hypothetical protein [Thiobacillus sp.]